MPRTTFTQDNVVETQEGFPRVKLIRGEQKRIICLEDPWSEYVHNLGAPKLRNGLPIKVEKKKFNSDETYEAYDDEFFGNPICLGDAGILREKGKDPKNCPICKAAENSDSFKPPKRRHAMHVVEYATRPNGQLVEPFSIRILLWSFTENIFLQLVTIAEENSESGGLKKHDLVLGPPEEPIDFQKFKIVSSEKAYWLLGGNERRDMVIATFQNKENRADKLGDLGDPYCGRRKNREWMEEAILKVKARWNIVNGTVGMGSRDMSEAVDTGTLSENLDDLLNMKKAPSTSQTATMSELLDAGMASKAAETTSESTESKSNGETVGFDDLMNLLGNE